MKEDLDVLIEPNTDEFSGEAFVAADVELSVPERFASQVCLHAHRLAVASDECEWTYEQLNDVSNRVAHAILERNENATAPVALFMDHAASLIAAILAVLKTGRPYVVVDALEAPMRQRSIIAASRASLLLTDRTSRAEAERLALASKCAWIDTSQCLERSGKSTYFAPRDIPPDAPAMLAFTSGSTGNPRGVCLSHRYLLHHCRNYTLAAELGSEDRFALVISCSLAASMTSLWGALLNGGSLFPVSLRKHGINSLLDSVQHRQLTVLHCVPTVLRSVKSMFEEKEIRKAFASLRWLRLGGESIHASDVDFFKRHTAPVCRLFVTLSSTETGPVCATTLTHNTQIPAARVSLGKTLPGMKVELQNAAGFPTARGQIGRIVVRSRYLATGYWHEPDFTADRFKTDTEDSQQLVFDTGDLGRLDAKGRLEHCGRADFQLKIRGNRVNPEEVEAALLAMPGIHHVAVVGQEDDHLQTRLFAYLEEDGSIPEDGELRNRLRERLPDHMIPATFLRMKELPRVGGGKIDRARLPQPAFVKLACQQRQVASVNRPNGQLEGDVSRIWEEILGKGPIGRQDDFFADLGGTSLQAACIITRIKHVTGVRLPLSALMHYCTIESLTEEIGCHSKSPTAKLLLLLKPGKNKPLFLIHRGYGTLYTYRQIISHLAEDQTVYGLESSGVHGECLPRTSLPAMARSYLQEIQKVDATGPYFLGGICLGGLIALEVAQQLTAQGRKVAFLGMINTTHPSIVDRRMTLRRRLINVPEYLVRLTCWRALLTLDRSTGRRLQLTNGAAFRRFLYKMNARARSRYRPQAYPGVIDLFIGSQPDDPLETEQRLAMGRLGQTMRVHRLPGLHDDIQLSSADLLGSILQSRIDATRQEGNAVS